MQEQEWLPSSTRHLVPGSLPSTQAPGTWVPGSWATALSETDDSRHTIVPSKAHRIWRLAPVFVHPPHVCNHALAWLQLIAMPRRVQAKGPAVGWREQPVQHKECRHTRTMPNQIVWSVSRHWQLLPSRSRLLQHAHAVPNAAPDAVQARHNLVHFCAVQLAAAQQLLLCLQATQSVQSSLGWR